MPTLKLTKREIESARSKASRACSAVILWDQDLKGFGCRVATSGRASWLVKKMLGAGGREAKTVKYVFGDYEEMNLDKARDEAIRLIGEIRSGVDLSQRKRQVRSEQHKVQQSGAFRSVVELYLQRNTQPGRFWPELAGRFEREIIPKIGKDTPIVSITKTDIRHLIETKEDTHPGAARTLFEALRPFFKWCVERDIITSSPMQDLSPPPVPEARDRVLTDAEVHSFWSATEAMGWPFGPLYQLLLLTAQRRDEVAGMRRSEIDLAKAEWLIPSERTKNGKEHLVHLSPQAVSIIQNLLISGSHNQRYGISDSSRAVTDLIFTTTGTTSLSGFSRAKLALDGIMTPAKPWRIHDLRRTAASGMASLGFQPHIVERVLNHVSGAQGGLVGVYQRYEFVPERKKAIEAWGNYVARLFSNGADTNVKVFPIKNISQAPPSPTVSFGVCKECQ